MREMKCIDWFNCMIKLGYLHEPSNTLDWSDSHTFENNSPPRSVLECNKHRYVSKRLYFITPGLLRDNSHMGDSFCHIHNFLIDLQGTNAMMVEVVSR